MKKGLSKFANYCSDRKIGVLLRGFTESNAFFDVYLPRDLSVRTCSNFEKRLRADNVEQKCHIVYIGRG